jgi:predicted secreted hydrolase
MAGLALVLAAGVLALALLPGGRGAPARSGIEATLAVREALAGGEGFARALAPRPFSFPRDHGPHPEFRTEWWYYTGNLATAAGRHLGFQLTFFRVGLAPPASGETAPARSSAWATGDLYFAHFALTDTAGGRFHAARRLSRAALGLAGARAEPLRVWVEDWSVTGEGAGGLPMRLSAAEGDRAIDLRLSTERPPLLQGDRGWSRKGPEPGNASYYYSFTRMEARGTVRIAGEAHAVSGQAWMDREWSTSSLGPDLVGWDWFAVQLDDGRDLMVYLLRRRDGAADPLSGGTLVAADGAARPLSAGDVAVDVLQHWTSPRSGVRYPAAWRVTVAVADLRLDVRPRLADQELNVGTRYWEGAVAVAGRAAGRSVSGHGYVELVGYGE